MWLNSLSEVEVVLPVIRLFPNDSNPDEREISTHVTTGVILLHEIVPIDSDVTPLIQA